MTKKTIVTLADSNYFPLLEELIYADAVAELKNGTLITKAGIFTRLLTTKMEQ